MSFPKNPTGFDHDYTNTLGVDIDGVLNIHREQFAKYLKKNTGKEIDPENISIIPVHNCPGLGVEQKDEFAVFNDPEYWTTMGSASGAAEAIRELRNRKHLMIHIFTSRPWPIFDVEMSSIDKKKIYTMWEETNRKYSSEINDKRKLWSRNAAPIEVITKTWLEKNTFEYDRLVVENPTKDVAESDVNLSNRYEASRILSIKYFVEDDLAHAEKLSKICDVVFLLDQPYNKLVNLPANVIRVKNWSEILLQIEQFS